MEAGSIEEAETRIRPSMESCTDPYLRCAFYGAALTALGVSGSALLAHSPQGCDYLVNNALAAQECDYIETMTLCTKLCVDEIVHGGEEALARTILRHQLGCDQPAQPPAWMVAAASKNASAILPYLMDHTERDDLATEINRRTQA